MTDPLDPFAPPPAGSPPPPAPTPYGAPPAGTYQPAYGQPAPPPLYGAPLPYGTPGGGRRNGLGVAALVLGIASVFCLFALLVPAVLAIVFGLIGRGRAKRQEATNGGLALAGVITGSIGLVFGVAFWAFFIANASAFSDYNDCQDAAHGNTVAEQDCADQLGHDLFGVNPGR
jgi:hypothetical protein